MQDVSVKQKVITKLVAFMMAFTPIAATGVIVGGVTFGSLALAQTGDTTTVTGTTGDSPGLTNVTNVACNAANIIRGPVGIALGFLVVVGGVVALQVASRDALPLIGRGVFGTALLLGASAAFAAVVSAPCTG